MPFLLHLTYEETSFFNLFNHVRLSDLGEGVIGATYICVCNAG